MQKAIHYITKRYKITKIGKLCEDIAKWDIFYQKVNKMAKIGKYFEENAKSNIFITKRYKIVKFGEISEGNGLNGYILLQKYTKFLKLANFAKKIQNYIFYYNFVKKMV